MRAKHRLAHRRWTDLFVDVDESALLFDLEATWWSPAPRSELLPDLRRRGVRVATLVYDLMPLRNPEWFDPQNRVAFVPWARRSEEQTYELPSLMRKSCGVL